MTDTTFEHWLAGLFGTSRSEVERLLRDKTALQFLIAWSLFENRLSPAFRDAKEVIAFAKKRIDVEGFDVSCIREYAQYFHQRYQGKVLYKNLVHDDKSPDKKPSRNKLLRQEIDATLKLAFDELNAVQILVFSTFVVYRFRNNIFHGNKGVSSWLKFADQIERCTLLMRLLISHAETLQC